MLEKSQEDPGRLGQVDLQLGEIVQADGEDDVGGFVVARDAFVGEALLAG